MVVMYANLKEAIWLENWGVGIRIPKVYDDAGLMVRDPMELREFLEFPTGWVSSFPNPLPSGLNIEDVTHEESEHKTGSQAESTAPKVSGASTSNSDDDEKPHDWARCESFWAGTYAFLDYSHFVDFNMRLAARRNALKDQTSTDKKAKTSAPGQNSSHRESVLRKPSLVGQEEAVGDCLQLRLELLPKSQQPEYNADEEGQEDDPDYPTLYFRGTTVTYWGNEAPMPEAAFTARFVLSTLAKKTSTRSCQRVERKEEDRRSALVGHALIRERGQVAAGRYSTWTTWYARTHLWYLERCVA